MCRHACRNYWFFTFIFFYIKLIYVPFKGLAGSNVFLAEMSPILLLYKNEDILWTARPRSPDALQTGN